MRSHRPDNAKDPRQSELLQDGGPGWLNERDAVFVIVPVYVLAFLLLLLATLIYAPFDFAGMMMLGDTGANPLGAFLG